MWVGKWWRLKTLQGVQLLNLLMQITAARMCNLNFLLKDWTREADRVRKSEEATCTIFTVQPYAAFQGCVWAVASLLDTFAFGRSSSVNNVSVVFCWGIPKASLSVFNFLFSRLPSVVFFLQNPFSGCLLALLEAPLCWKPLAKKNVGDDPHFQSLRQPVLQEITSWKKNLLEPNLQFEMG